MIIEDVIHEAVKGKVYDQSEATRQAETIVRQIQQQVKTLSIPAYKIIV